MELDKSILTKEKYLTYGNEGIIFINNNKVIKIYHPFYKMIKNRELVTDILIAKSNENNIRIENMISKQSQIKLTELPIDRITYYNLVVGVLSNFYNHSCNLFEYLIYNPKQFYSIMEKLLLKVKELTDHYIYDFDLRTENIVVSNNIPYIVDLDSEKVIYSNEKDKYFEYLIYQSLKVIILDYCTTYKLLMRDKILSASNDFKGLERIIKEINLSQK